MAKTRRSEIVEGLLLSRWPEFNMEQLLQLAAIGAKQLAYDATYCRPENPGEYISQYLKMPERTVARVK